MTHGLEQDQSLQLRLEVVAFCDQPPEQASVHIFSLQGGSIGRSDGNDFVLPDSESVVSRTHALISYEGGDFFIVDKSTNGTFVNDSLIRLQPDQAYRIGNGDRLLIGNYLLVADLLSAGSSPFDVSPARAEMTLLHEQPDKGVGPGESGMSLRDHDDFDDLPELEGMSNGAKRPNWFPTGDDSNTGVDDDALANLDSPEERPPVPVLQRHIPQPAKDHSPEKVHPMVDRSVQEPKQPRVPGTGVPTGYIPGASQFEALAGALVPDRVAEPSAPSEQVVEGHIGGIADEAVLLPGKEPITTPSAMNTPEGNVSHEENAAVDGAPDLGPTDKALIAALIDGLGSSAFQGPPENTIEFVRQVGQLTHEAIQGMIDMLRLRDEFKREFYVPVTRIAPIDNNVFKHSANVDDALVRAFSKTLSAAYLGPVDSTRQAFQDIAAHQLALVAGMQAAVTFLLQRFSPQVLEERMGKVGVLNGVLPHIRKAHMWEHFEKEYAKIAEKAEEDFQRVFGQHFERAYTEHISQLHSAGFGGHKNSEVEDKE